MTLGAFRVTTSTSRALIAHLPHTKITQDSLDQQGWGTVKDLNHRGWRWGTSWRPARFLWSHCLQPRPPGAGFPLKVPQRS